MKKFVFLWTSLLASGFAANAQTATPTKIGIVHIQNAILGTSDGKKAVADLESRSAPKKRELERMQGEIQGMRDQLNKTSSVGSEEQKNKLMRDIDARTKSFNRQVEDAQTELDQEQGRLLNEIGGRMLQVIDKYGRDNGYALIIDVSNQNTPVLFASNSSDLTQEIVGLYDKNTVLPTSAIPPTGRPATGMPLGTPRSTPPTARPVTPAPKPAGVK